MKPLLIIILIALSYGNAFSQTTVPKDSAHLSSVKSSKMHKGFYARLGIGPVFGNIKFSDVGKLNGSGEFKGTGAVIELLLGYALSENLILDFDMTSCAVSNPEANYNSSSFQKMNNFSVGEVSYGIGVTYYFMPANFYLGASVGAGAFVFKNDSSNTTNRSEIGFSYTIKAGKMFWLGNNFGLGIGAGYGHTATTTVLDGTTEELRSNRMFISAALSFN